MSKAVTALWDIMANIYVSSWDSTQGQGLHPQRLALSGAQNRSSTEICGGQERIT